MDKLHPGQLHPVPDEEYSRLQKKAPVGESDTLLFFSTRGILNEFFIDLFA
jgi:hypothetical protein